MTEALIIGAGPAGLAAALQLQRRGADFILLERQQVGGLLNNANLVENYPGFPGGIAGEALIQRFHQQVTELGVAITYEDVVSLEYADGKFRVLTPQASFQAPMAIIASGTLGNTPENLPTPSELSGRVLTEILPIKSVTGKRVTIIGAGDLAFDYALNLGRRNEVLILNRSQERKCLPLLWARASHMQSITYQEQTQLVGIQAGNKDGVELHVEAPGGEKFLVCDFLVYAIGRRPNTGFITEKVWQMMDELEQRGVLFRIGDVKNGIYRQAAIAVGDGILAAMHIIRKLEGRDV